MKYKFEVTRRRYVDEGKPLFSTSVFDRRPAAGVLIGCDGRPWMVSRVDDLGLGDWSDRAREMWVMEGSPKAWSQAPFRVVVVPPGDDAEHSIRVEPWHQPVWDVLPEHYAVCALCGYLAPCSGHDQAVAAKAGLKAAEAQMALPSGCCPACRQPVTARQRRIVFPGPNLINPLGRDGVAFHERSSCIAGAAAYEELWVRADRRRELRRTSDACEDGGAR